MTNPDTGSLVNYFLASQAAQRAREEAEPARREALAAYAHEAWAGWMQYLFEFGHFGAGGSFVMNADKVERWQRQMQTPYERLSEDEKQSDRAEADKMIAIFEAYDTP